MKKTISIITVFLLLVGASYFLYFNVVSKAYLIPAVPDYTFYTVGYNLVENSMGSRTELSPLKAVLDMVFDYWSGQKNYLKVYPDGLGNFNKIWKLSDLADFARSQGFEAEVLTAKNVKDLHKFINANERTPIIVIQPPSLNYMKFPKATFRTFRLVIGLDDRRQRVITHDFTFGNNYEISYGEFEKLWQSTNKSYLVIRPKDYKERIKFMPAKSSYPQRIPAMEQKELLENVIYLNELYFKRASLQERLAILNNILNQESALQYFLPVWRLLYYANAASSHLSSKNINKALELVPKIIALNHNLDQKFDGWTYQWPFYNESAIAWLLVGDIYLSAGYKDKALSSYQKALSLSSQLSQANINYLKKKIQELSQ